MDDLRFKPTRKAFISFLDDNDTKVDGYFDLIHMDASFVKFKSGGNVVSIPTIRIFKIKEKEVGEDE